MPQCFIFLKYNCGLIFVLWQPAGQMIRYNCIMWKGEAELGKVINYPPVCLQPCKNIHTNNLAMCNCFWLLSSYDIVFLQGFPSYGPSMFHPNIIWSTFSIQRFCVLDVYDHSRIQPYTAVYGHNICFGPNISTNKNCISVILM